MAKKAKKSKGKSKGKSSKSKSDSDANFVSAHAFHALHDDAQMLAAKTDWVRLDIALVNWAHMHFTVLVRADSTMHTIARIIQEKTGSIDGLKLFKDPPNLSNEITSMWSTLTQCGYRGGQKDAPGAGRLFYDFTPRITDSLLLTEPTSWSIVDYQNHLRSLPVQTVAVPSTAQPEQPVAQ